MPAQRAHLLSNRGYSLVEVLVAITVLLIALVGPLTIAYSGLKRSNFAKEQTASIFMAQEGTEAIVKLREDSALAASSYANLSEVWSNLNTIKNRCPIGGATYCGVTLGDDGAVTAASVYQCSGSNCLMKYSSTARVPYKQGGAVSGDNTIYTRKMQIDVIDAYAHVISTVSWGDAPSQSLSLETYVYNTYYEP